MTVDLNLLDCKVLIGGEIVSAGISVNNGKIVKVGKASNLPKSSEALSLGGLIVIPGLIDVHVHLREPGLTYKEDFLSGTSAAAAGGFTTVLDMPNTIPYVDSPERVREKAEAARASAVVNVGLYGTFPSEPRLLPQMVREGALAFKANLLKNWSAADLSNPAVLSKALYYTSRLGRLVAVHAEDKEVVEGLRGKLEKDERSGLEDFFEAHPEEAEVLAAWKVLKLAPPTGRIHLCHISSPGTVELVREAKERGLRVTCEVTPHHLFLALPEATKSLGSLVITEPPIRDRRIAELLWSQLVGGMIDIVASDHAPHMLQEKDSAVVWNVAPGVPGLETTLPLFLTLVNRGDIDLAFLARVLSQNPAKIFGLQDKGVLWGGYDADLTVIEPRVTYTIDPSNFQSRAKWSPFEGWHVRGRVVKTFVGGRLVYNEGEIVAKKGSAKVLDPNLNGRPPSDI